METSNVFASFAFGVMVTISGLGHASAQAGPLTAIDIALEPDQAMNGRAHAANAALLKDFPHGYALDDTHHAHISVYAGYVPNIDLPKVYAAAGKVFAKEAFTSWKLTAFKYYYIPLAALCGRSRGGKARFLVAVIKLCECACAARVSLFG
jgi:hypothetical protein